MLKGMICLWFGLINAIPDGWLVCDGTNATPDLRNRFIVCAGGALNPGDTGGTTEHQHTDTYATGLHTIPPDHALDFASGLRNDVLVSSDSFTTENDTNLPPYHALAYIMKEG